VHILKSSTYVLEIKKSSDTAISVGSLGKRVFNRGIYLYVGSAKKNMLRRIQRHLKKGKRLHWHIDYLLEESDCKVKAIHLTTRGECETADILHALKAARPIPGFGCSDCRCESHLFFIEDNIDVSKIM